MRKLLIILICCTAVLLAGYAGYRGYKAWKQTRMIALARVFIAKRDARSAWLALNQVLRANPRNIEACRLMADLQEALHSPEVLVWRGQIVDLNPNSLNDRLALARTAMECNYLLMASNALWGVKQEGKRTCAYQNLSGALAARFGQHTEAEAHFLEACRLDPTNALPQLNLAVVRLNSTNDLVLNQARTDLKALCAVPLVRSRALNELIRDASPRRIRQPGRTNIVMRPGRTNDALVLAKELVQGTNALFSDQMLRLEVLRWAESAEFQPALEAAQRQAADDIRFTVALTDWQRNWLGPTQALGWVTGLPANIQTNSAVALVAAECRTAIGDWTGLQASLKSQNWERADFLRHAYLARAMRGQGLSDSAKTEWGQAARLARESKHGLYALMQHSNSWGWNNETEELLWTYLNQYPGERWVAWELTQWLFRNNRTRSLMSLYRQLAEANPADLSAKNNFIMTALLLDAKDLKAHELAQEVYRKAPTNAVFASTYAFSLHAQKKHAQALDILEKLDPKELQKPTMIGYYGLILKGAGNGAKGKSYLDLASTNMNLLPEERRLFEQAMRD